MPCPLYTAPASQSSASGGISAALDRPGTSSGACLRHEACRKPRRIRGRSTYDGVLLTCQTARRAPRTLRPFRFSQVGVGAYRNENNRPLPILQPTTPPSVMVRPVRPFFATFPMSRRCEQVAQVHPSILIISAKLLSAKSLCRPVPRGPLWPPGPSGASTADPTTFGKRTVESGNLLQERLGFLEVRGIESFGEPVVALV
jgi:hypothetical protein